MISIGKSGASSPRRSRPGSASSSCPESLQGSIASPRFEVGPMATGYENAITDFQQNVLDHTDSTS